MKLIRTGRRVLTLLLALTMLAGVYALAVDVTAPCSLTLHFGAAAADDTASSEMTYEQNRSAAADQELQDTAVQIAVYKLASAEAVEAYDAYSFTMESSFSTLEYKDDMTNDEVRALASAAQEIAAADSELQPAATAEKAAGAEEDVQISDLEAGLYLVLLYTEGQSYGTVETASFTYTFSPVLVSLPSRYAEISVLDNASSMTSDNDSDWAYDVTVNLEHKGEFEARVGSIYLQKTFETAADGVTCIFEVNAVLYGETVFSNMYSMNFTGGQTTQTIEIPDLPVGAVVTVTEVYAGVGAQLKSSDNTTITVVPGAAQGADNTAVFVNTVDDNPPQGGSITNKYTAELSEQGDDRINWTVQQLTDSQAEAAIGR